MLKQSTSNPALNLAPFGRWTLRDKGRAAPETSTLGPIRMQKSGTLSSFERGLAVCLSLAWLCGGAFTLYFALVHSRWGMGFVALAALIYGAAWLRVAALSRLLRWPELIAPWRRT